MPLTAEKLPVCSQEISTELRELKDRYIRWMFATRYAENSIKAAHFDLEWFYRFLEEAGVSRIRNITLETLNDYSLWLRQRDHHRHKWGKISLVLVCHRLIVVRQFFKWLYAERVIIRNPAEDLDLPRLPSSLPQTILTQEEVRRLLDAPNLESPVGYRDKALLEVLYATGMRSSEIKKLKLPDVDLKGRTVFIREGKGGKDRLIPLPTLAAGYLREYIAKIRPRFARAMKGGDDGTVFLNYTGSRIDINRLCHLLKANAQAAKLDKHVTALTLRHSIASHLLENGMEVRCIQEFLGHERLSTTQVYTKVTLSGLRKHYNKHHPREKRASRA